MLEITKTCSIYWRFALISKYNKKLYRKPLKVEINIQFFQGWYQYQLLIVKEAHNQYLELIFIASESDVKLHHLTLFNCL